MHLLEHQEVALMFTVPSKAVMVAFGMGCLTGDTLVTINCGGNSRKISIARLYDSVCLGGSGHWHKYLNTDYMRVRSLVNGEFHLSQIEDVFYSGKKEVFRLLLENGKHVDATLDHRILTERGWVELGRLTNDDVVLCNGIRVCSICNKEYFKSDGRHKVKHTSVCKPCNMSRVLKMRAIEKGYVDQMGGDGYLLCAVEHHPNKRRTGNVAKHRLVIEASWNGYTLEKWLELGRFHGYPKGSIFLCKQLHVHHKNHDKLDNRLENLEVLSESEHTSHHGRETGYSHFKDVPTKARVIGIVRIGVKDTFDISVPSCENFVANGIVVHNCGKSAIAINTIMKDYSDTKRKSIVICPAYLALNWKAEFAMWWPEATVSIEGFKGKPSDPNATVIISSYERFEKVSGHLRLRRSLIVDEAHYLCGDSQRTKNIKEAAKSMKLYRLVLLTGTPMQNKVGDLYNLLWILDAVDDKGFRKGFGTKKSFQETFQEYTEMRLPRIPYPIRKYHGAKNLDYLKPWLKIWWMRANIEDVVTLPGIQEEEITIHDIPEKLQKLLAQAWELQANGVMPEEDHKFGENVGEHISTAKANTAIAKAPGTAEFARDLIANGQGPIVVFTDHIQAAKDLFRMIDNDGSWKSCRCAVITGETPMAKRSDIVDKFQRGDLDCLVGTIGACSTGITLTRSNVCIMNDYAWNPGKNAQAVGRIYRISQKRHCHVYVMTGGDIDKDIMKQLREKMTIIKELENL